MKREERWLRKREEMENELKRNEKKDGLERGKKRKTN